MFELLYFNQLSVLLYSCVMSIVNCFLQNKWMNEWNVVVINTSHDRLESPGYNNFLFPRNTDITDYKVQVA